MKDLKKFLADPIGRHVFIRFRDSGKLKKCIDQMSEPDQDGWSIIFKKIEKGSDL
jgi:hypothetical protein